MPRRRLSWGGAVSAECSAFNSRYLPGGAGHAARYAFLWLGGAKGVVLELLAKWVLQHWALLRVAVAPDATPAEPPAGSAGGWPALVFSHGNGGDAAGYTALLADLASNGFVVCAVQHGDGTCAAGYDLSYYASQRKGDTAAYDAGRRTQVAFRRKELIVATNALKRGAVPNGLRIDGDRISVGGHSMGGASAIAAAAGATAGTYAGVLLLDPVLPWLPDDAALEALTGPLGQRRSVGGTAGGSGTNKDAPTPSAPEPEPAELEENALPMMSPLMPLGLRTCAVAAVFCELFMRVDMGGLTKLLAQIKNGTLGDRGSVGFGLKGTSHHSFADAPLLVPHVIARTLLLSGDRPPVETLAGLRKFVLAFLSQRRAVGADAAGGATPLRAAVAEHSDAMAWTEPRRKNLRATRRSSVHPSSPSRDRGVSSPSRGGGVRVRVL